MGECLTHFARRRRTLEARVGAEAVAEVMIMVRGLLLGLGKKG